MLKQNLNSFYISWKLYTVYNFDLTTLAGLHMRTSTVHSICHLFLQFRFNKCVFGPRNIL